MLLVFIGVGCAANQGLGSEGYQKEPLPTDMADMEKPQYDENSSPELVGMPSPGAEPHVPGQVIVKFKPEMNETQIGKILTQYQLAIIKALPLPGVYQVGILGDNSVEKVVETLSKEAAVVYAEPNFLMQTQ